MADYILRCVHCGYEMRGWEVGNTIQFECINCENRTDRTKSEWPAYVFGRDGVPTETISDQIKMATESYKDKLSEIIDASGTNFKDDHLAFILFEVWIKQEFEIQLSTLMIDKDAKHHNVE